jgi:hypothetical protein
MGRIVELKEQDVTECPVLLFECAFPNGVNERWSTHTLTVDNERYEGRVLSHSLFNIRSSTEDGLDSVSKISLVLANADSYFSQIARQSGFRGAKLRVRFCFYDLVAEGKASDVRVLFYGVFNDPDEISESSIRLTATSRFALLRNGLPEVRIQKRCPWTFPSNAEMRREALDGGAKGKYSALYRCGYSATEPDGLGNLNGGEPFTSCDFTRGQCEERGMFSQDRSGRKTARFGGMEFVPASILVRGYGQPGFVQAGVTEDQTRYNDCVPLCYGTVWMDAPVVFARNDGNLTRLEVLLGLGEIAAVHKVLVNDVEIPEGVAGANMGHTGWYNVVSFGGVSGGFNLDFTDGDGAPLGDPYGSMAFLSVVTPNRISDGRRLPQVRVLLDGLKLPQFDLQGVPLGEQFSNNPAWVLMDLLRRSGWSLAEINVPSFAATALHCAEPVEATDLFGTPVTIPRYQCNLLIRKRTSAADLVRGVCNNAGLFLNYDPSGRLELRFESHLAGQQPLKPEGSNSTEELNGGWPAYEFGDGSSGFSGILRHDDGKSSVRLFYRSPADTVNRLSVEFQDQFNEYQQDSLSLVDLSDYQLTGQEVSGSLRAIGLPNFHQAMRILRRQLDKSVRGGLFVEFDTSVKAICLRPGDIITVTYQKEGLLRQPFRVVSLSPTINFHTVRVLAQIHDDGWYSDHTSTGIVRRQDGFALTLPRPIVGNSLDDFGNQQFDIKEEYSEESDGKMTLTLSVHFRPPRSSGGGAAAVPLLSLSPEINTSGGNLSGGQTLYYAVTGKDSGGGESVPSFVVRARIPARTATNCVRLKNLRFSPGTVSFNVYRGPSPSQLLLIAHDLDLREEFVDSGLEYILEGPPDPNFDYARFEWRLEQLPECQATIASSSTVGNTDLALTPNQFAGMAVRILSGKGAGQERIVASHDVNTFNVATDWDVTPDSSSRFVVVESTWRPGAVSRTSPSRFTVPNREGAIVHVIGRAGNAHGRELGYDVSPMTRWRIGGAAGPGRDADVPPQPTFSLFPTGKGTIEVTGIGFTSLENVRTVQAGTITIHYWDELSGPTSYSLSTRLNADEEVLSLEPAGVAQPGDLLQIDREIVEVVSSASGGLVYQVRRGTYDTTPVAHEASAPVYHLLRKTYAMTFSRDFFGSPASGTYAYSILLPNSRIAAADFYVTNTRGSSQTSKLNFTGVEGRGLRTLSGGQVTLQVEGNLAIQSSATPAFVAEAGYSVGDIFAVVQEAPRGGSIDLRLRVNGEEFCRLTIPDGGTMSNVRYGFDLPPIQSMSTIDLDVLSVPVGTYTRPGRDLTVTIRL